MKVGGKGLAFAAMACSCADLVVLRACLLESLVRAILFLGKNTQANACQVLI